MRPGSVVLFASLVFTAHAAAGPMGMSEAGSARGDHGEQTCAYTAWPITASVAATGGSGQVAVTAPAGCAWNAVSGSSWLSVSPATGTGNGTVTWTAASNPLSTPRIGVLTIAGRGVTVNQGAPGGGSISPSNLAAQVSGSTLTLTWTAAQSISLTGYLVEAGSASGLANIASMPTGNTGTTFVAQGVPPGSYFLRVRAVIGGSFSAPSNEVTATISGAPAAAPGAPVALSATATGSSVTFAWSAPASGGAPTTYVLSAGSSAGSSNIASFATGNTRTTFTATGVPNGPYFARVSAQNAMGTSAASNEVSFIVGPQPCTSAPLPPSGLQSVVSGRVVTLTWVAPAGTSVTDAYQIEAGSAPALANLATVNTGSTATIFAAAAGPGTYYVRVRAVNGCGVSTASAEVALVVS